MHFYGREGNLNVIYVKLDFTHSAKYVSILMFFFPALDFALIEIDVVSLNFCCMQLIYAKAI